MEAPNSYDVIRKVDSNIRFTKGFGQTGEKTEIVEKKCEWCGYDRMLMRTRFNPEFGRELTFKCQDPSCRASAKFD